MKIPLYKIIAFILIVAISRPVVIFVALNAAPFITASTPHVRGSHDRVKEKTLKIVPKGIHVDKAMIIIKNNWSIECVNGHGVTIIRGNPVRGIFSIPSVVVGETSIEVYMGEYYNPFKTAVLAFFAFDNDGILIDVFIKSETDAP